MNIETYNYFLIVLGGFALVWGFRKFSLSRRVLTDFEYLGFSTFWGVILISLFVWVQRSHIEQVNTLLSNPYAAGVTLAIFGYVVGACLGRIARPFRY
jgi:hypothetical protein